MTPLTPSQKLSALIAYLDHVISIDKKRTPGEWPRGTFILFGCSMADASFISESSLSYALMAKAVKAALEKVATALQWTNGIECDNAEKELADILSLFPDELLALYVK